ncbi:MAG: hypothetical protein C4527_12460 [Candidatus Omnitrophota bacterium]|nr:MAG: hypothetical protein C4527_12460 [Candidatus Omnitrophota bacterium]
MYLNSLEHEPYYREAALWMKEHVPDKETIFHMAAPYHLVDLYTRGAPAECIVFVFLPLFFCYATRAITDQKDKQIVPAAFYHRRSA